MKAQNLPVLVYGTLRNGGGNYNWALDGYTTDEKTVLISGLRMYAGPKAGFPYVTRGEADDAIVAELMYVADDLYVDVIKSLDNLEGYEDPDSDDNLYNREIVEFELDGESVQAYIYLAGRTAREFFFTEEDVIASGDWKEFEATRPFHHPTITFLLDDEPEDEERAQRLEDAVAAFSK